MKIFHFLTLLMLFFLFTLFDNEARAEKIEGIPSKSKEALWGRLSNLSEPNKFFTGRKKEIRDIADGLSKNNTLIIAGISGIGKTQLAKQYAYSHLKKYDLIWWFDSEKNMDAQADELLAEIFRRKNKPYYRPASSLSLANKLKETLASFHSNWLIIFDNIDDTSAIVPYFGLKNTDSFFKHVIVTSKKMNTTHPSVNIQKFQREESIAFLSKILEGESEETLNELAETLGNFPLALAQAAGYIKMNPSINVRIYIELFKDGHSELWSAEEKVENSNNPLKDNYSKTISTAIRMNMASIKDRSTLAYDLLCFCSLLHHHHIPFEILEFWACSKRGASKLEFHEALSLLLNYFLMEKEIKLNENSFPELFNQHELIQFIAADTIDTDAKKIILEEAADSILQRLVNSSDILLEQFKNREYFCSHMEKICDLAETMSSWNNKTNELSIAFLYCIYFVQRDFDRAANYINILKDLVENNKELSPLAKIWFYCTSLNDKMFENLSEVKEAYEKTQENLKHLTDQETKKSYLLHAGIDYAESLSNFGKIKEALSICDILKETVNGAENNSQKPSFFGASALIRLRYGQYDQCLEDLNACFKLISGEKDHQYMPFSQLIRAHCLLNQGQIQKAYELIEETYPHLLELFTTPECPALVNARLIKGACLAALKKLEEAARLVEESLNSYEKSSGFDNDVHKGMGYRILGEIFEAKDDLPRAYEQYTKAEHLYENILQEKTLDELGLLYTRLAILGAKQGDDSSLKKYLSLHIENFGLAHPRTFEIKKFLDEKGLPLL